MSAEHEAALRAVSRDRTFPRCADIDLVDAQDAGLIRFNAWPACHWSLTDAGRAALATLDTAPRQETTP